MMKAIGFIFILISLLFLIKYFDRQRDHFDRQRDNFSVDHNSFQNTKMSPMGTTRCQGNRTSRGQICVSTFVPKTDEDLSMEANYKKV